MYKILFLLCIATATCSANAITGRVVNGSSAALASARVWIKNNPTVVDSTGPDGKFSLTLPTTANHTPRLETKNPFSYELRNNHLNLCLSVTQSISLFVFDITGKKVATLCKGERSAEMHIFALNRETLPAASGSYILQCVTATVTAESI